MMAMWRSRDKRKAWDENNKSNWDEYSCERT